MICSTKLTFVARTENVPAILAYWASSIQHAWSSKEAMLYIRAQNLFFWKLKHCLPALKNLFAQVWEEAVTTMTETHTELGLPSQLPWGPAQLWTPTKCVQFTPDSHLATKAETIPQNPRLSDWGDIQGLACHPLGEEPGSFSVFCDWKKLLKTMPWHWGAWSFDTEPRRFWLGQAVQVCLWWVEYKSFSLPSSAFLVFCCHLSQTYTSMYFSFPLTIKHLSCVYRVSFLPQEPSGHRWLPEIWPLTAGDRDKWAIQQVSTLSLKTMWFACQDPDLPLWHLPLWESLVLWWGAAGVALLGVMYSAVVHGTAWPGPDLGLTWLVNEIWVWTELNKDMWKWHLQVWRSENCKGMEEGWVKTAVVITAMEPWPKLGELPIPSLAAFATCSKLQLEGTGQRRSLSNHKQDIFSLFSLWDRGPGEKGPWSWALLKSSKPRVKTQTSPGVS